MQFLTRGFLLSDAREKGGHPGRRERKPVSLRMRPLPTGGNPLFLNSLRTLTTY